MTTHTPSTTFPVFKIPACRWWLVVLASLSLWLSAIAQETTKQNFNLPSGEALKTLRQFTEQSGEQIVYPSELLRGVKTNAVSGEMTARQALDAMLLQTGLVAVQDASNGALAVTKAPPTSPEGSQVPQRDDQSAPKGTTQVKQPSDGKEIVVLDTYVVNGMAQAMMKAQENKRNSLQVVESVVADDINKLPDLSVTEALQRVTGVSISRELGEGANVALRGLNEVTATLNGQEVFSPQVVSGEARVMNLQTVPSEMISAINVIKTPMADMIEGGIAGTIDIRLRRPLDFNGQLNGSLTTRLEHGEAANSSKMQYSGVLTDTWKVGQGKLGALINYTIQERDIRQDLNSNGKPVIFNQSTSPVVGYDGSYEPRIVANRKREGASGVLQWAPVAKLRLFAEYDLSKQTTIQDSFAPYFTPNAARTADDIELFAGKTVLADHDNNASTAMVSTPVVKSLHVTNGSFSSQTATRDWEERTGQFSTGASWHDGNLSVEAEFARTTSRSEFDNLGAVAAVSGVSYTHNVDRGIPSVIPDDPSLITISNLANWNWSYWYFNHIINEADSTSASLDLTHRFQNQFLVRRLKYGMRLSDRNGKNNKVAVSGSIPGRVADYPSLFRPATVGNFLDGASGKSNEFLEISTEPMRPFASAAKLIGANPVLPAASPGGLFDITEKTRAVYAMSDFELKGFVHFDGNLGVRVIGTDVKANGFKRVSGVYTPIVEDGDYTDVLPSLNTRWFIQDDLFLRLSVSKQLSRQSFSKLNPNVQLTPPPNNTVRGTGKAGNPSLDPLRTNQFDISVEKYFNESTYLYVSAYYKKINGYTQNAVTIEDWDGVEYEISRPYAVDGATIKGAEVGYQQFFTFLPGPLSGLGLLANYTFVDAEDPAGVALTNLSRNGYNVILMYEKAGWTGRLAYNWRDTFTRSNNNVTAIGSVPIHDKAFGWLDASLSYRVNDHLKVSLDVSNALRTRRTSYFLEELYQHEDVLEDRQFYLSASWSL